MVKQEVIDKISGYFRLTGFEAEKIFEDIFAIIMEGVKEDNIVDVTNFGEFIIKYDNGKGERYENNALPPGVSYKRTVEFLAATEFEEELRVNSYETTKDIADTYINKKPEETPEVHSDEPDMHAVEEELMKKREAILSKLAEPIISESTAPVGEPVTTQLEKTQETDEPKKILQPQQDLKPELYETTSTDTDGLETKKIPEEETANTPYFVGEDISKKTFSDYLSEVGTVSKPETVKTAEPEYQPTVIPLAAVELHKEIVQSKPEPVKEAPVIPPSETVIPEEHAESKAQDKSYYIWYKDSEANPAETQNMSYEYELLYQAAKEAEYKSKLKIYVTTFILFFSIVLVLLIFSPLIYKVFFTPEEIQNTENITEQVVTDQMSQQKAAPNVLPPETNGQQNTQPADTTKKEVTPPVTAEQNQVQQQTPPQQQTQPTEQKQEVQKQTQPPPQTNEPAIEGVTKNSMGWQDSKFNVIYVKLDNGKYAFQESSWDSEAKANNRINAVDKLKLTGMKGSAVKVDIPGKGAWFRVRFGEFSSLQEAHSKAEELRKKEK
ncbi:MAG: SPOR domain-containing protein [Ignavibacteria bacterium]|jgi:nucleoid DNA-binding protein